MDKCLIQLAYGIGLAEPISFFLDSYGTNKVDQEKLAEILQREFALSPKAIRQQLGLNKPIYKITSTYGHFGRQAIGDLFPWEKTDLAKKIYNMV